MQMKKLVSRAKKILRAKRSRRTQLTLLSVATVLATLVVVTSVSTISSLRAAAQAASAERTAESKKARAELAAPAANFAAASSSRAAAGATGSEASAAEPITLTGCLEPHHDGFQLKDASGDAAPRSRSWKSGFLKKGAPALDVVDAMNRLKLKDHVGQRVSVTGVLVDREIQARSLKGVGTCGN